MDYKRVTIVCGHYGSGKTNIAVNMSFDLKSKKDRMAVVDLDIVNPYFRTLDSKKDFEGKGIRLICSAYANSNLDAPAIPQEIYSITDQRDESFIIDVGGDDRGALALGRISQALVEEGNYDMLMVINCYRPLTRNVEDLIQIKEEIEYAARIRFTGLINNSNIGRETTPQTVMDSLDYANKASEVLGLPIVMTSYAERLDAELKNVVQNPFAMKLQRTVLDM